jgi:hypothetical protein
MAKAMDAVGRSWTLPRHSAIRAHLPAPVANEREIDSPWNRQN